MKSWDRTAVVLASVGVIFVALFAFQVPASAITINRTAIVSYADQYSCNHGYDCHNTAYIRAQNDCQNFASQALRAGGFPMVEYGSQGNLSYYSNWYYHSNGSMSTGWAQSKYYVQFAQWFHRGILYQLSSISNHYTPAQPGDLYFYDWGKGKGISHSSVEAGWGYFSIAFKEAYTGDYMDQHSTDRYHAPYNYGYLHPDANINVAKMKIYYLSLQPG